VNDEIWYTYGTKYDSGRYCQVLCAKRNEQLIEINRKGASPLLVTKEQAGFSKSRAAKLLQFFGQRISEGRFL